MNIYVKAVCLLTIPWFMGLFVGVCEGAKAAYETLLEVWHS